MRYWKGKDKEKEKHKKNKEKQTDTKNNEKGKRREKKKTHYIHFILIVERQFLEGLCAIHLICHYFFYAKFWVMKVKGLFYKRLVHSMSLADLLCYTK